MITAGQRLRLADGDWQVAERLGEGGQGVVWRLVAESPARLAESPARLAESPARLAESPARLADALKWYEPASATATQREALSRLVRRGAPSPAFLWPEELVEDPARGGTFGYVMALRPPGYRSISDLLLGRFPAPPSLLLRIGVELAHAFLGLHTQGLCYRDISFGNVFVNPDTGAVLVCDNDNVGVDGESRAAVLGTRRFMAPEVIRREAEPSAHTDLHSLAVLVFYLLALHHPLLGRRQYEHPGRDGETFLLGTAPMFIFDPVDASNRPDPDRQPGPLARWELVPPQIRALFEQSFTAGLRDPAQRVRESVWRAALSRARDALRSCPRCGGQTPARSDQPACARCGRRWDPLIMLRSERDRIVLNADTTITRHHVYRDYDLATVVGRVVFDRDRRRWGIRNVSEEAWLARLRSGGSSGADVPHRVEPAQTVGLADGLTLRIGPRSLRVDGSLTHDAAP